MFYIYANGNMIYHLANPELYLNQPKLTLEMGKAGSLEFGIMPDHAYYDRLPQLSTIITVDYDKTEIFRGRVLSNTRDFQNMRKIYCEGDLAYLVDTVQKFSKYNGTVHALFRQIITNHNTRIKDVGKQFTVGNITVEDRSIKLTGQDDEINVGNIDYKQIAINSITDEWNTTYDLIQTCIIDYVGGYLNTRRVNNKTYIDLLAAPSDTDANTTTQEIELGVNMLDLEEEISAEDLFTVLVPLGDDNLTISSVNNGSDEIVDTNAVSQYGRIVRTHVFSNVNEASTLLENGRRYLATNVNIPTTLTINALDMHIVNPTYDAIHLCDKVHIKSTVHNIVEYLTCTKIEYDLENPANDTYTFGNPTQTLTQRYREDKRKDADTYGPSSHGGGGGGVGAAVEAAADAAGEDVDDKLNKFYDSWIDLDPSDGDISLGAAYKRLLKMHNVLSQWGIDALADDTSSAVNINTLYETTTLLGETVSSNYTELKSYSDANSSEISAVAGRVDTNGQYIAALNLSVSGDPNDPNKPGLIKSVAQLKTQAGTNAENIASLTLTATEHETLIEAKADKIYVDSEIVTVTGLIEAEAAKFNQLISGQIRASFLATTNMSITGNLTHNDGNGYPLAYGDHSHSVTADNNGKVTIGYSSGRDKGSFNIADTKFYKDGVKAAAESATLISLGVGAAGSPYDYDNKKYADVKVKYKVGANRGDGTWYYEEKELTKATDVSSVISSVTLSSIALNGSATYESANKRYKVPVKATASNGNSSTNNLYVSATDAFNAGKTEGTNSVTISSIALNGSATYESANKRYKVPVKATASNSNSSTNNLYVSATEAFNAGVNTFEAVSVTTHTYSGQYWYSEGSSYSYSGTNRGSQYSRPLYTPEGSGYREVTVPLYYSGTSYSYSGTNLGTRSYINVITGSSTNTYYQKK